jgi:hypothetical protein
MSYIILVLLTVSKSQLNDIATIAAAAATTYVE